MAPRWLDTAFSGEGARLAGGRWNGKGTAVVYLGGSLALAALELLVHVDHARALDLHHAVPGDFDASLALAVDPADLATGFPAPASLRATQALGDAWVRQAASVLLEVPSAVVPLESNYLFNPHHPEAGQVVVGEPVPFRFDARLLRE